MHILRMKCSFAIFSLTVMDSTACSANCVRTGERMALSGVVEQRRVYGPPNFGETPQVDERRRISVLRLSEPLSICAGTSEEIDDAPIHGVDKVQLVGYPRIAVGRRVRLTGRLERAANAFHYTPVFLSNE